MTSTQKDQLTIDNSNDEPKIVVSNEELKGKILVEIEQFELGFAANRLEAVAHLREAKELLKQIN